MCNSNTSRVCSETQLSVATRETAKININPMSKPFRYVKTRLETVALSIYRTFQSKPPFSHKISMSGRVKYKHKKMLFGSYDRSSMIIDRKSVSASVTCPPLSVYGSDVTDFPFSNLVSEGQHLKKGMVKHTCHTLILSRISRNVRKSTGYIVILPRLR